MLAFYDYLTGFDEANRLCLFTSNGFRLFQQSQFVAKAKILKVTPDSANNDYHDADIELITLYKGERRAKIKILSVRNSSCFFLPSVNSTWIIFVSVSGGTLSFGSCSGSLELDRVFDTAQYPNAGENYSKKIALKQQVLEYLSSHGILNPNPPGLYFFSDNLRSVKGYKNLHA